MERVVRHATISHFFLLLGYKIFSFYFPLFLIAQGFSLPQVGFTYLLIYLPIALTAPFAGILNHRVNPVLLASLGIGGYGVYALAMLVVPGTVLFYAAQVFLGISAALFVTSFRSVLMGSHLRQPEQAFGWFYSAPFYVDAIAPALGAILIWQFGFPGVFFVSMFIHAGNGLYTFFALRKTGSSLLDTTPVRTMIVNYGTVARGLLSRPVLPLLLPAFSILLVAGFYNSFFVLFLKDLGWSQNLILVFGSVFAVLFFPVSLFVIHRLGRQTTFGNVFRGGLLYGGSSLMFAFGGMLWSFGGALLFMVARSFGGLMVNAGRSGLLSRLFPNLPEETGAVDTVFAPLGRALGALGAGLLIGVVGYSFLFAGGGVFIVAVLLLSWFLRKRAQGAIAKRAFFR